MAEWPFERMNRSRSGQSGWSGRMRRTRKYSAMSRSIADNGPPMWPAPLLETDSSTRRRPRRARSARSAVESGRGSSALTTTGHASGALADDQLDRQDDAGGQGALVDRLDQRRRRRATHLG